jgi:hypothetical protein
MVGGSVVSHTARFRLEARRCPMVAMSNSTVVQDAAFAEVAPPSERDVQVYEAVAALGLSSRGAADVFGISQTRVLQIRQRVEEWIGRHASRSAESLSPRERLIVAADLADRRSQMLFSEAMEAWRGSQDAARERCTAGSRPTGPLQGDTRYLAMAMRTNMHMLQVAGLTQRLMAKLDEEAATIQASTPSAVEADTSSAACFPLVGDCSPSTVEQVDPAEEPAAADCVNTDEKAAYDEQEARRRAFLAAVEAEMAPVQPPQTDAHGMLLEEGADEAWTLDFEHAGAADDTVAMLASPPRPLTRRERKARQRLLARKLRKAK